MKKMRTRDNLSLACNRYPVYCVSCLLFILAFVAIAFIGCKADYSYRRGYDAAYDSAYKKGFDAGKKENTEADFKAGYAKGYATGMTANIKSQISFLRNFAFFLVAGIMLILIARAILFRRCLRKATELIAFKDT